LIPPNGSGNIGWTRSAAGAPPVRRRLCWIIFRIGDILRLDADQFCATYSSTDNIPQHIFLRHFVALRSVLDAYTGRQRGGPGDICSIISIDYENDVVTIDAILYSETLNDKTDFCVRCRGCREATRLKLKRKNKPDA
jgi:hypothetical protein